MKRVTVLFLMSVLIVIVACENTGQKSENGKNIAQVVVNNSASDFPGTPAGKAAEKFVEVISNNDRAQTEAYIKDEMTAYFREQHSISEHLELFSKVQKDYGNMQVIGLREMGSHKLSFMGKSEKSEKMIRVTLEVETETPHKITSLELEPDASFGSKTKTQNQSSIVNLEDLDSYLNKLTESGNFSGSVLLAKDGKAIFENAYGMADRNKNIPNKVNTKFNLGSINKFITATAVLQLVEKGKIDLNATLNKYTDIFPKEVGSKVTVRHLLQHKSGWSHYWENDYFNTNLHNLKSLDDYMVFIRKIPLEFEPGTQLKYSNTGYEVLGHVIEKVSGMNYDAYVQHNIYNKAGMSNTGAFDRDKPIKNAAIGYTSEGGKLTPNTKMLPLKGTAAGGGLSTVVDFLKFENALFNLELVNEESLKLMFNRYKPGGEIPKSGALNIGGGGPGVSTSWYKNYASGYSVFVFSNSDMGTARPIGNTIIEYTKGLNSAPKDISFYNVSLSCGAVPTIGCGISTKPVLLELQEQKGIKTASLNRSGTAIAVAWDKAMTKTNRDEIVQPVFDTYGISVDEASGVTYDNFLASIDDDNLWYEGKEVDKLSKEEAAALGKKVTAKIREYRKFSDNTASNMETDIRTFFEGVLTKDYKKNTFEEEDVTTNWMPNIIDIVEKYVGKGNFPEEVNLRFGVNSSSKKIDKTDNGQCVTGGGGHTGPGCTNSCCKPAEQSNN